MVSFFPEAKSASVSELRSLDLIVARFRDVQCFAIRCHHEKGNNQVSSYLLLGPKFPDGFEEPLLQDYLDGHEVLTFGGNYRFDINTTPDAVVFSDAFERFSGLVLTDDSNFFRFKFNPSSQNIRMAVLNLATGDVTPALPEGPKALVTKWGISVGLGAEEKPVVVIPTQ